MRAPRHLIVIIAAGARAVAGGSTLADAHGCGHHGKDRGKHKGNAVLRSALLGSKTTAGKNTVPQLAATVFCGGAAVGTTAPVAFSPEGDARIDQMLATSPPSPCLAPAVLINPAPAGSAATGTYIAASGA